MAVIRTVPVSGEPQTGVKRTVPVSESPQPSVAQPTVTPAGGEQKPSGVIRTVGLNIPPTGSVDKYAPIADETPSFASRVVGFGKEFAKETGRVFVRGAVSLISSARSAALLAQGRQTEAESAIQGMDVPGYGKIEPFKIGPDVEKNKPYKPFGKETLESLGAGIEVASLLEGGGVAKAAVKTTLKEGGKVALKQLVKTEAKKVVKDFALGSAFGAATETQKKEATPGSVAKSALEVGAVSVLLPRVVGLAAKGLFKSVAGVSKLGGDILDSTAGKLENFAQRQIEKRAVPKEAAAGKRLYEFVDRPVPSTLEQAADKGAKMLRSIQSVPRKIERMVFNDKAPVTWLHEELKSKGIEVPDLPEAVEGAQYRILGKAQNKLQYGYLPMRDKYGNDWQYVKEFSRYLDAANRESLGQEVSKGADAVAIRSNIEKLKEAIGPDRFAKVQQGQRELQTFLRGELDSALDSGRITKDYYDAVKIKYKDYIPHDVLDFVDPQEMMKGSRTLNVTQNGFKRAIGSTKEIDDIDATIVRRIFKNATLDERNKAMAAVIQSSEKLGDEARFMPLRTKGKVEARIAHFQALNDLRDRIKEFKSFAASGKAVSKQEAERIAKIEKKLFEQETEFANELAVLRGEHDDEVAIYDRLLREREERKTFRESLPFHDTEAESNYQAFRKVISRNKDLLVTDADGFVAAYAKKKGMTKAKVHDLFFTPASEESMLAGRSDDELLEIFKDRFAREQGIPKEVPGVARTLQRVSAQAKRTEAAQTKLEKTEAQLTERVQTKRDVEAMVSAMEDSIAKTKERRKGLFDDLTDLRDTKVNAKEMEKLGYGRVSYFNQGVREDWLIPKDVANALKGMDDEEAGVVLSWLNNSPGGKFLTAPASMLRELATQLSPVFQLFRNPVRDIQQAHVIAGTQAQDFAKGLWSAIGGAKGEADDVYRLALKSGALQGTVFSEGISTEKILAQTMQKAERQFNPRTFFGRIVRPDLELKSAGKVMEEMSRMATFKRALQQGLPPSEAAKLARNATVDFGKAGSVMRVINKLIPFTNARVQGTTNLIKSVLKDPVNASRALMWTAAYPAVLLNSLNSHYESYANIPDYEKRKFWIVMLGEEDGKDFDGRPLKTPHYVKIPKGDAQQVVANVMERVMEIGKRAHPDTTKEFLGKLLGDFTPIHPYDLIPPGALQAIELKTNYSFFKDKQIEPDYIKVAGKLEQTKNVPAKFRYTASTSNIAKALGQYLDWSPIKIDHVIRTGVLNDVLRSTDLNKMKEAGLSDFGKATRLPVIGDILGNQAYGKQMEEKRAKAKQEQEKTGKKIEKRIEKRIERRSKSSVVVRTVP